MNNTPSRTNSFSTSHKPNDESRPPTWQQHHPNPLRRDSVKAPQQRHFAVSTSDGKRSYNCRGSVQKWAETTMAHTSAAEKYITVNPPRRLNNTRPIYSHQTKRLWKARLIRGVKVESSCSRIHFRKTGNCIQTTKNKCGEERGGEGRGGGWKQRKGSCCSIICSQWSVSPLSDLEKRSLKMETSM